MATLIECRHTFAYASSRDAAVAATLRAEKSYPRHCDQCGGWYLARSRPPSTKARPSRPRVPLPDYSMTVAPGEVRRAGPPGCLRVLFVMQDILSDGQPLLENAERRMHWGAVNAKKKALRDASCAAFSPVPDWIGRIPYFEGPVIVLARAVVGPRTASVDVGAISPTVKALLDGAVDAGVIEEDSPQYVQRLVYEQPHRGPRWMVELEIIDNA